MENELEILIPLYLTSKANTEALHQKLNASQFRINGFKSGDIIALRGSDGTIDLNSKKWKIIKDNLVEEFDVFRDQLIYLDYSPDFIKIN